MAKPLNTTTYMRTSDLPWFMGTFGFTQDKRFDDPRGTPGEGYYRERRSQNISELNKIFKDKAVVYGNETYSTVKFYYDYEVSDL